MKKFITRALACAVALVATSSAFAAQSPSEGHYEWRASGQQRPGIRAPLLAPERVWVANRATMSRASDCTRMMATSEATDAASCMAHCAS
jgi:hypothetical protein